MLLLLFNPEVVKAAGAGAVRYFRKHQWKYPATVLRYDCTVMIVNTALAAGIQDKRRETQMPKPGGLALRKTIVNVSPMGKKQMTKGTVACN